MSTLWLCDSALDAIIKEADEWFPLETGGLLLGYRAGNDEVVITGATIAGPEAVHRKKSYTPDVDYDVETVERIFNCSNGAYNYLGDWHTHPNGVTILSNKDKRALVMVATTPEALIDKPIMGILGGCHEDWNFHIVQFVSGKKIIWPFIRCTYENMNFSTYKIKGDGGIVF